MGNKSSEIVHLFLGFYSTQDNFATLVYQRSTGDNATTGKTKVRRTCNQREGHIKHSLCSGHSASIV